MNQDQTVAAPGLKIATAWLAAIGIASWSDAAAALAALYSLLLIGEWVWKKISKHRAKKRGDIQ